MKTIEEKAKAYDEVIRKLRGMMPNWERLSYNGKTFLQDLIYIIPELAQSEDEKIRNFLIDFIKVCGWTEKKDQGWPLREECIAWLEKQGEKDKFIEKELGCIKDYRENAIKRLEELEKQGEQKQDVSIQINPSEYINDMGDNGCYLKNVTQASAWSEEDEHIKESIITGLEMLKDGASDKSLIALYNKKIEWLKSIRPQSQWKPSDMELEVLRLAAEKDGTCLMGLYEQLKKLREE